MYCDSTKIFGSINFSLVSFLISFDLESSVGILFINLSREFLGLSLACIIIGDKKANYCAIVFWCIPSFVVGVLVNVGRFFL